MRLGRLIEVKNNFGLVAVLLLTLVITYYHLYNFLSLWAYIQGIFRYTIQGITTSTC